MPGESAGWPSPEREYAYGVQVKNMPEGNKDPQQSWGLKNLSYNLIHPRVFLSEDRSRGQIADVYDLCFSIYPFH